MHQQKPNWVRDENVFSILSIWSEKTKGQAARLAHTLISQGPRNSSYRFWDQCMNRRTDKIKNIYIEYIWWDLQPAVEIHFDNIVMTCISLYFQIELWFFVNYIWPTVQRLIRWQNELTYQWMVTVATNICYWYYVKWGSLKFGQLYNGMIYIHTYIST